MGSQELDNNYLPRNILTFHLFFIGLLWATGWCRRLYQWPQIYPSQYPYCLHCDFCSSFQRWKMCISKPLAFGWGLGWPLSHVMQCKQQSISSESRLQLCIFLALTLGALLILPVNKSRPGCWTRDTKPRCPHCLPVVSQLPGAKTGSWL